MSDSESKKVVDLDEPDSKRLSEIKGEEDAINGRIAQIDMNIKALEERREQLLEMKGEVQNRRQDTLQSIGSRYNIDTSKTFKLEDGNLILVEDKNIPEIER